jgi:hypothetical protein
MQPQALVAVERHADWSEWMAISRSLADVVMVIQAPTETSCQFRDRVVRCVMDGQLETGEPGLVHVVLMRRSSRSLPLGGEDDFAAQLGKHAAVRLSVYPRARPLSGAAKGVSL